MKKKFYFLLILGVLTVTLSVFGQKTVVVVQPDAGLNVGALNNAIKAATNPGNTIFELKRGGLYLLNGAISHTGYTLHIRAEQGTGARPILQPALDANGASSNHFNPGASLTLEGLYIQARDEKNAIANRQIIVSGNGNRIILKDCILDYSNQAFIRLGSSYNKIFIQNSILRNALRPENPTNGRVIDTRSNPQDTLVIENSTIYNCFAAILSMEGGFVKYVKFDHNTVFQSMLRFTFTLNKILKADVTNNIFYGVAITGNAHSHDALFAIDSIKTVGEYSDKDRYFNLSNNNFYQPKEYGDTLSKYGKDLLYRFAPTDKAHKDTIKYKYTLRTNFFVNKAMIDTITKSQPPVIWKFIKNKQVDTTNVFREKLTFKNLPPMNLEYWKFFVQNSFNIGSLTPPNAYANEDSKVYGEVTTGAYNFGYNTGSKSARAATGGKPLGDPRWALFTPVSAPIIKDNSNDLLTYPNPFNESVTFNIKSEEYSNAKIAIYDLSGREIYTMNKEVAKGNNSLSLNLGKVLKSGVYFYQVQLGLPGEIKSVSRGKLIKN